MINIHSYKKKKTEGQKLSMLTCYDASFARILAQTEVDMLLVGDSVAMVQHGFENTLSATIEMMESHTAAVKRGAPDKCIIGDLPFMSFRKGLRDTMENSERLMRAGATAVKLEGVRGHEQDIQHLVESGIPVMGHLGLTPQSLHQLGGHKIQGKTDAQARALLEDAKRLEDLGSFCVVLECVPADIATKITQSLSIPTIGIGAGSGVDGQVLVLNDMLGMNSEFTPKFLKRFANFEDSSKQAINAYLQAIQEGSFPSASESY